jgi:hypothetical protein
MSGAGRLRLAQGSRAGKPLVHAESSRDGVLMSNDNARPDPAYDAGPDASPGSEDEFREESLEGNEFTSDLDSGQAEADVKSGTTEGDTSDS